MHWIASLTLLFACGTSPDAGTADAAPPCVPPIETTAPAYSQLFASYFAPGKPGHCATAGCHADPDHDVWLCGTSPESCYAGMVSVGLIDPVHGDHSLIGNSTLSPLSWIAPNGNMPFDATGSFPEGRDAILAWVAACAQNN